ncbi:MAG: hypothetical protein F9K29_14010 [Hyphomicrobiaceae bacterium]|nr:MAG: hypothetical protein F9K29_14010 [Hyphomicrobiaceae bacterium]
MTMRDPGPHDRLARVVFAVMALGSVLVGLAIYVLHARLGIEEGTARLVSTAFLIIGIADTLVLFVWDRFRRRQ